MLSSFKEKTKRYTFFFGILALFLFSNFPGRGGLEGDQRNLAHLNERSDNWGFLVPLIYGEWPDGFLPWRYSLIVFQLLCLWVGLWLIFFDSRPLNKFQFAIFLLLTWISSAFSSQLWRDSSLFAFLVLGLGLIKVSLKRTTGLRILLFILAANILLGAALFKPAYGFLIGLLSLWILRQESRVSTKKSLILLLIPVVMTFSPYLLEKSLVNKFSLQKSYPEQQPIIFDLATNYCWGSDSNLIEDARIGLSVISNNREVSRDLCSAIIPSYWDTLHSPPANWKIDTPLFRLTSSQEVKLDSLKQAWLTMILNSPFDWIQTKVVFIGPALFSSNSFVDSGQASFGTDLSAKSSYILWKLFNYPIVLLDKTRVLSFAFLLIVLVLCLVLQRRDTTCLRTPKISDLCFGLVVTVSSVSLNVLTFVASNGRYMMPFILASFILLLRSLFRTPVPTMQ